jgi:hypothetical protein
MVLIRGLIISDGADYELIRADYNLSEHDYLTVATTCILLTLTPVHVLMPSEGDDSKVTCDICQGSFHSRGFKQHHRSCKVKQEEEIQKRTSQAKLAAAARLAESRNAPKIEGKARYYMVSFSVDGLKISSAQNEASDTITPCHSDT